MAKVGDRVRSIGPTVWPVGKVQDGTVTGVIQNATPFGTRDSDSYVVTWDNGQVSFPLYPAKDFSEIGG